MGRGDHKISMCVMNVNSHFLNFISPPGPTCQSLKLGRLQGMLLSVLTKLITYPVIHLVQHQKKKC